MAIDIKKIVENIVERITSDEQLKAKFLKEPIKVVEKLINVDLPDEQLETVVELVKGKIKMDDISDVVGMVGNIKKIDDISDVADIAQSLGGLKGLGKLFGK